MTEARSTALPFFHYGSYPVTTNASRLSFADSIHAHFVNRRQSTARACHSTYKTHAPTAPMIASAPVPGVCDAVGDPEAAAALPLALVVVADAAGGVEGSATPLGQCQ
jgi:hypothetical protein